MNIFKNVFVMFLRTRHAYRHFRRHMVFDVSKEKINLKDYPPLVAKNLLHCAKTNADTLLQELNTHANGLNAEEVEHIQAAVGKNEVLYEKPLSWWLHLWICYNNPFSLLLTALALVSLYSNDIQGTIVISTMVLLSTFIRFWQEFRSNKSAEKLKALVSNTATTLRRAHDEHPIDSITEFFEINSHIKIINRELPITELVPGDIILLSAGDMIPADSRIITAKDLFISQSAMTGESLPVEKFATLHDLNTKNPIELDNILFMGTNVVSGTASAVVISTGSQTCFGVLAQHLTATDRAPTAFQAGINKVSWLLLRFMIVMTPIVLLINGFSKGDWPQALLFALSVAVGLTPEMLPMIVTSTLATGAILLSQKKVIVKRLDAVQNFGAMDVLCTDKTGTLTQDKIVLESHLDIFGKESEEVLEYAYLNSYYQTGLKNLLDRAVLENIEILRELNLTENYRKIDEIPFDFQRRRMSVMVSDHQNQHILICKGAAEEILKVCTHVQNNEKTEPLTSEKLASAIKIKTELNEDGLRVVAVASKIIPTSQKVCSATDEAELTLIGYIAFLDPPKESAMPALKALKGHGIRVKILTGDNALVTAKVCHEVGLARDHIILGSDLELMSDAEFAQAVEEYDIFAKLAPLQKERVVRVLRANGHVVGFLGDGINDAPAIRAADIGISVDSAVDIAKEAADIILLEKSLMILDHGVIEGRKTFSNMLKYIKMAASSNFGNVFSVVIASIFLPFLPMLPLQLLTQNLLYDISQIAIPLDNVDNELIKLPLIWKPNDIGRFMIYFGPMSSIFDITTFCLMWFYFSANSIAEQNLFQSGWFIEGLLSQTLIVHMIRTKKIPFIQSRASWPLLITTSCIMMAGIFLPMGIFANYFEFVPLPNSFFLWLVLILLGYVMLTQGMKMFYIKRFGWQ